MHLFSIILFSLLMFSIIGISDNKTMVVAKGDLADLSLEELMNIEVTTVSKKAQKIFNAPASITIINREEIIKYGYRTVSEALSRIPGIYLTNDRNYENLGFRGFSKTSDFNTRILLLIDGYKINDPVYDQAAFGEEQFFDIENIERIEIIKGPGSSLWGTNALLAIINIIPRKGGDIEGFDITASYGSFNNKKRL